MTPNYAALSALFANPTSAGLAALDDDTQVAWDQLHAAGSNPKLRRWQAAALPAALCALHADRHGVIAATTGSGKSILLAELLRLWLVDHPTARIVVSTPTVKLVEQLGATLTEWLGPGIVGLFYTGAKQWKRQVVVCCNPSAVALAGLWNDAGLTCDVWIADECHRTEAHGLAIETDTADTVGALWPTARRLGVTATPFRSDTDDRIRLFDEVIYRYPPAEALRDGVIVPWRIVGWGDERAEVTTDEACIQMIREMGPHRGPGVVNASTIDDAVAFADTLTAAGFRALPVHSRLGKADQAATIAKLRVGEIDVLVHVAMLVEGVDLPWLRWLCLRRAGSTRVRFIQEVGRVLRACTGKTEAVILDPNNLFDELQLSYEEALGWVDPAEVEARRETEEEEREREDCADKPDRDPTVTHAARTTALGRYARQVLLALLAEGIAVEGNRPAGTGWRAHPATPAQAAALRGAMARPLARVVDVHREALRKVADADVTKGIASDLFDIFSAIRKLKPGQDWTPAAPVRVPCADAFVVPELPPDPTTYVAGAMKGGFSAVAIVRGGKTLYAQARPTKAGDSWQSLTRSAAGLAVSRHAAETVGLHERGVSASVPVTVVERGANPASSAAWGAISRISRG